MAWVKVSNPEGLPFFPADPLQEVHTFSWEGKGPRYVVEVHRPPEKEEGPKVAVFDYHDSGEVSYGSWPLSLLPEVCRVAGLPFVAPEVVKTKVPAGCFDRLSVLGSLDNSQEDLEQLVAYWFENGRQLGYMRAAGELVGPEENEWDEDRYLNMLQDDPQLASPDEIRLRIMWGARHSQYAITHTIIQWIRREVRR